MIKKYLKYFLILIVLIFIVVFAFKYCGYRNPDNNDKSIKINTAGEFEGFIQSCTDYKFSPLISIDFPCGNLNDKEKSLMIEASDKMTGYNDKNNLLVFFPMKNENKAKGLYNVYVKCMTKNLNKNARTKKSQGKDFNKYIMEDDYQKLVIIRTKSSVFMINGEKNDVVNIMKKLDY